MCVSVRCLCVHACLIDLWRACRYCTNYYGDAAPAPAGADMCDWCRSDVAGKARYSSAAGKQQGAGSQESSTTTSSSSAGRGGGGKPGAGEQESGRRGTKAAGRRYKLLKDVLC